MAEEAQEVPQIALEAVIGFNGHVFSGLKVHPDKEHLIYPLGCTVIIKSQRSGKQTFLHGHTNNVSCISVSKSGRYIASGQVTFMGFKADIIIWDYEKKEIYARLVLHKARVEDLSFSPNDKYLVSLGGQDDASIVVWNIESKEAICGSPASAQSAGHCLTIEYTNLNDEIFVSAGNGTLRVWELDLPNRKIRPTECQTGQLKRIVKCLEIPNDDNFFYCGTTSGDILKVNLKTRLLNSCGPVKQKFSKGVNTLKVLKTGDILVGSGDGMLSLCSGGNFKTIKSVQLEEGVTSVTLRGDGQQFYVGTEAAQIYSLGYIDFKPELIATNHNSAVKDVAFPFGTSELFATCSQNDIRVWHTESSKELLRIMVPNITCNALGFMQDGRSIFSACAVSGGGEGQVRVWEIFQDSYRLIETMKEHKATVNCIKIKSNDKECVTASSDGACIIWDLVRFVRNQMVLSNTLFSVVCYHPEEFQIITSGTDRKIGYWEVYDGSAIRELEGSLSGAINGMHISEDGKYFVTGGDDKLLKLWHYSDGEVTHVGVGHSGSITNVRICPNSRCIVSTSADGAILRWRYPQTLKSE
ncbi:cilia- and flagella-associated protein 52-like [Sinocyclocheilus anshuiensis]|uniref:cilia- and flagella-associated protein 52-like n=1 Tax=Sinocyclocheilus anshuiensis TaxID=1608454 RepID=UPI0007B8449D|nr:PREDICTED: cilia- and flagella-associated protein 52-like [Sinocyclocheilus anshuiensis]